MISQEELNSLARLIIFYIEKDFEIKHLSKNLINTIYVTELDGNVEIHIPAKTYDMLLYKEKQVVVHNNRGSYANQLNDKGSELNFGKYTLHPDNHKGYVDRAIMSALEIWKNTLKDKYTMTIIN